MIVHCIGTGSSGNCYLIEYEPHRAFMLDYGVPGAGVTGDEHKEGYYSNHNIDISDLSIEFCLISHFHIDHLADSSIVNNFSMPIYLPVNDLKNKIVKDITEQHRDRINYCGLYASDNFSKYFSPKSDPRIKIYPFEVEHDVTTLGYKIVLPNKKVIVYMTDFGTHKKPLPKVPYFSEKVDLIMIECNWDPETIEKDKSKIAERSKEQHCSTESCYEILNSNFDDYIKNASVLLLHKSGERLTDRIGYKIFSDLECKDCRQIQNNFEYVYDDEFNLVKIYNNKNQEENINKKRLNKKELN